MSKDFEIGAEQDRLKCRLLPAEERGYVERLKNTLKISLRFWIA